MGLQVDNICATFTKDNSNFLVAWEQTTTSSVRNRATSFQLSTVYYRYGRVRVHQHILANRLTTPRRLFPEVYMNGDRPAMRGVIDKEKHPLPTPSYGFGWILPSVELFHAIDTTDEDTPL